MKQMKQMKKMKQMKHIEYRKEIQASSFISLTSINMANENWKEIAKYNKPFICIE